MSDILKKLYDTDGYIVIEDFLGPEECKELKAAGLELTQNLPEAEKRVVFTTNKAEDAQMKQTYFIESNDKISYFFEADAVGPDGELKVKPALALNKVGHALHLKHPVFKSYSYNERVKMMCRELNLVQPAIVQSMYIYKNPGVGGEVTAHQDATYLYTEPKVPLGFWIALDEATEENGCLWVAGGSHKSGVHRRMVRDKDEKGNLITKYDRPAPVYADIDFTPLPVKMGTCVILHGHLVHKSAANRSAMSRHAYTFHVIEKHENNYSEENWLQEGENAPFFDLYSLP